MKQAPSTAKGERRGPVPQPWRRIPSELANPAIRSGRRHLLRGPLTPYSPAHVTSEQQFGLLYGAYSVGVLLTTPLFGYLGDRIGYRRPMIAEVILSAAALALFCSAPQFYLLLLARLFQGNASAATSTAGLAVIAEHYLQKRVEMMGLSLMGSTGGSLLGPVIGGSLYEIGGYTLPLVATGVLDRSASNTGSRRPDRSPGGHAHDPAPAGRTTVSISKSSRSSRRARSSAHLPASVRRQAARSVGAEAIPADPGHDPGSGATDAAHPHPVDDAEPGSLSAVDPAPRATGWSRPISMRTENRACASRR